MFWDMCSNRGVYVWTYGWVREQENGVAKDCNDLAKLGSIPSNKEAWI